MSMLSAQCEKLRGIAVLLDGAPLPTTATEMRMAANTIESLSDKCATLRAENEELRKELEQWRRLTANITLPEYPACEFQPKDLERENDALRDVLADLWPVAAGCMAEDERDGWREELKRFGGVGE